MRPTVAPLGLGLAHLVRLLLHCGKLLSDPLSNPLIPAENFDEYWQAWFDGSARPNPGEIGIGVILRAPDGARYEKSERLAGQGCNNEAELRALCALLELAFAAGARRLRVRGDSDVAIRYVNGPATTEIEPLHTLLMHARAWLERFDAVHLSWIPQRRNGEADRLARQALGLPERLAVVPKRKRHRFHRVR
jgi:ribonuclease HI